MSILCLMKYELHARWNRGKNHLLFNMLPGTAPDYTNYLGVNTANAMVAGGGFSSITYRRTFDVTIPVYNPFLEDVELTVRPYKYVFKHLFIFTVCDYMLVESM